MKDKKQNSVEPSLAEFWSETITDRYVPDPGLIPIGQTLSLVQRLSRNGSGGSLSRDLFQRYGKSVTDHPGDMPFRMKDSMTHDSGHSTAQAVPVVQSKAMGKPIRENSQSNHMPPNGRRSSKAPSPFGDSSPMSHPVQTAKPIQRILNRAMPVEKPKVGSLPFIPGVARTLQGARPSPPVVRGTIPREPSDTDGKQNSEHRGDLPDHSEPRVAAEVPASQPARAQKAPDVRSARESIHGPVVQGKNGTAHRSKAHDQPQGMTHGAGSAVLPLSTAESGRVTASDSKGKSLDIRSITPPSITKDVTVNRVLPSVQRKLGQIASTEKSLNRQTGFAKVSVGPHSDVSTEGRGPVGKHSPATSTKKTALGSTELPVQSAQKIPLPIIPNMTRPVLHTPGAFRPVVQAASALSASETLRMGNISHPVSGDSKPRVSPVSKMQQGLSLSRLKSESSDPMITRVSDMPLNFVRPVMPGGTGSLHPGPVVQRTAETAGSSSSQTASDNNPESSRTEIPALSPPQAPAQGTGQLSDLAEQVYALIMERLSMERESLGL